MNPLIARGFLAALAGLALGKPFLAARQANAQAAPAAERAQVPVDGDVDHPDERVAMAGGLSIETRTIQDTVFNNPDVLEMVIDFSGVRGVGRNTRRTYETQAQVIVHRPLLPRDEFEVTFPYAPGGNPNLARTAVVTIDVTLGNAGRVSVRPARVKDL